MGSQTLEILRQGIWASLTGGWFYDPHQNIFCNTVHLYIWLFLLCTPFSVYLYFPPSMSGWALYCACIALLFSVLKLLNHFLHYVYDTTECIIVQTDNDPPSEKRRGTKKHRSDDYIEMQVGVARMSTCKDNSDNESVTSIDYHKPNNSTIDLKVDVHRKNSSESSTEDSTQSNKQSSEVNGLPNATMEVETTSQKSHNSSSRSRSRSSQSNWIRQRRNQNKIDEISPESGKSDDAKIENLPETSRKIRESRNSQNKDFFKEWLYLDNNETAGEPYQSKFARRLSTDSKDGFDPLGNSPPKKRLSKKLNMNYVGDTSNVRRNSHATMSTIQLPLLNSTAQLVSHVRRGCKVRDDFLPTGSVELGAYMLRDGVRRIRSAALDRNTPSTADLAPQPVSAETVANSRTSAIPPPSKCLVRNPHLNLCPHPDYGSEIVYPIAEISDEPRPGSASPDSYSDYSGPTFRGFDWDVAQTVQSDEDFEETGSRSPLLCQNKVQGDSKEIKESNTSKSSNNISKNKPQNDVEKCESNKNRTNSNECLLSQENERIDDKEQDKEVGILEPVAGCSKDFIDCTEPEKPEEIKNEDEHSLLGVSLLFEEEPAGAATVVPYSPQPGPSGRQEGKGHKVHYSKSIKSHSKSRTSSQKENKKKDKSKEHPGDEILLMDAVEAQAALVQDLECLFAATNANTVVMPPYRQSSERRRSDHSGKTRKRSIEEVAQTSTNTLLPTSMPLLAAFLNSRHVPIYLPTESNPEEPKPNDEEQKPFPLMDRNHRNRMRKIRRSTRQRNRVMQSQAEDGSGDKGQQVESNGNVSVHFASSFDDTTDGAIHCFMDEYGNWMSYTFDKNSSGGATSQPAQEGDEKPKSKEVELPEQNNSVGSCGSLASDTNVSISKRRGVSLDQSLTNGSTCNSSNQGSNNPLLSSNNNLAAAVPNSSTSANKRFNVFDGGTNVQNEQPRSPVAYVTDSLLEQIEAERLSRMGIPSVHINYIMRQMETMRQIEMNPFSAINMEGQGSIGDNSIDLSITRNKFNLIDSIENASQNQPKSFYKFKLFKCWKIKITMDRLKLMALFDRNLSFFETFVSIFLAISVAVLGSVILSLGYYKDIYAFWFCFIIAGSQYSLLKSVQPDSSSPVHGFNKMVVFSRPVYFCLCSLLLYVIHNQIDVRNYDKREKRSIGNEDNFTLYGITINEKYFLLISQEILSKFLLFLPLAFSFGLFPQVNTFVMYLFEQLDMHIFGGNATCSLSASIYCLCRSFAAVGILYGFAYSGLIEDKKSQHVLFSIFCGLSVAIAYHLSRSTSDYSMIWNLIKKHLIPPDLYAVNNAECTPNTAKSNQENLSVKFVPKNNSESNISKQNSMGSSTSKINFSSETNISRNHKRSQTSSVSSLKMDTKNDNTNSSGSVKVEMQENAEQHGTKTEEDLVDPLPKKLQETVNTRLKNDLIVCTFLALFVFGIHSTTVFTTVRPELVKVLWLLACLIGWTIHYLIPQLRVEQPFLWMSTPVLKMKEHNRYETVEEPAKIMWFEKVYVYLCFLERNLVYPIIFLTSVTQDSPVIVDKLGPSIGSLVVCICLLKCLRNSYSDPDSQHLVLVFSIFLFRLDFPWASETFLVDYFIMAIIYSKICEFLLKLEFIVTYIAPWQITWGSAFHAFAQPFSVPHSAMLFLQAALSSIISAPLNPLLGSAVFITSYVRPIKFWERDYNTKRVDQSNTRLSSQLDRNLGADDNNLNSIFYEHLTRSLQHYLYGDLVLGRWGPVQQGDCFVLTSDYLNCLVHLIELGNGLVTFQVRGLEFRGTYCQQREVEAITEAPEENDGCCCCLMGHLPRFLSVNAMFGIRWLAWRLISTFFVLEGYSISDNNAISMLQVFDFRKMLISYYVKSIIFYTITSDKLEEWLSSPTLMEALKPLNVRTFVDLDAIFNSNLDEDYDFRSSGITRSSFSCIYEEWLQYCISQRSKWLPCMRDHNLLTLCFALSLLGRRALAAATHNSVSSVEFFLFGLHSLFKGDFRITCARDEWVFTDVALLHSVLAPAVRMALKLHQDHFRFPEEYTSCSALYSAICTNDANLVICHEASPIWRHSVLRGAPQLLALRHVMDEGNDEYKVIMLNKRLLGFRVIKLNRECVRGLWAGQQQELVYLRNRNPERGSIQNAKQALRNIINSSCDQPIGYPIYVSPLTTSYSDTSQQYTDILGSAITVAKIKEHAIHIWNRVVRRCREGCSSGSGLESNESGVIGSTGGGPAGVGDGSHQLQQLRLSRTSLAGTRGSVASGGKPSTSLASLAGLLQSTTASTCTGEQNSRPHSQHSHRRQPRDRSKEGGRRSKRSRDGAGRVDLPSVREDRELNKQVVQQTTPDSSLEEVRVDGAEVIANRVAASNYMKQCIDRTDTDLQLMRRYLQDSSSRDFAKVTKEIKQERESYRDLTGKYSEIPFEAAQSRARRRESSRSLSRETSMEMKTRLKKSDSVKSSVSVGARVMITDSLGVYDCINLGRRIDVQWPNEYQRERGGRNFWDTWIPLEGMNGTVVHRWTPNHRDPKLRSHVDKTILLLQINDKFVPIAENCVQDIGDECLS